MQEKRFESRREIAIPNPLDNIDTLMINYIIRSEMFHPNEVNKYPQWKHTKEIGFHYYNPDKGTNEWQEFREEGWRRMDTKEIIVPFSISRVFDNQKRLNTKITDYVLQSEKVPKHIKNFVQRIKEYESHK